MFIPIGDDNRDRHLTPIVNYLFIIANFLVFIFLQDMATDERFVFTWSTIPAEIISGHDLAGTFGFHNPITGQLEYITFGKNDWPVYSTLFTSMFMHGGWAHLLGNMLYLYICGDNIENDMGHLRYFIFYLLCGLIAGLSHVFSTYYFGQNPYIPSLGASGAISGVLGGYLMMHPTRRMHVWVLLGVISVPAIIVVGLWFIFQVVNGMGALGGKEAGGIAYAAHIGGFIAGFILVRLFANKRGASVKKKEAVW